MAADEENEFAVVILTLSECFRKSFGSWRAFLTFKSTKEIKIKSNTYREQMQPRISTVFWVFFPPLQCYKVFERVERDGRENPPSVKPLHRSLYIDGAPNGQSRCFCMPNASQPSRAHLFFHPSPLLTSLLPFEAITAETFQKKKRKKRQTRENSV